MLAYIVMPKIDGIGETRRGVAMDPAIRVMFFIRVAIFVFVTVRSRNRTSRHCPTCFSCADLSTELARPCPFKPVLA